MGRNEVALLYAFEDGRMAVIKHVLAGMKVRVRVVEPAQYRQPVGFLVGMEGIPGGAPEFTGPAFEEPMLVMYGFSSKRIDELLKRLKRAGAGRIGLKAVVTQYNCKWNSIQLHAQLSQERRAMGEAMAKKTE